MSRVEKPFISAPLAILLSLGILTVLGLDGRLHWDEPHYLYAAIYQDLDQILRGEVQATSISNFTTGKILHLLTINGIHSIVGNPPLTALVTTGLYAILVFASLILGWHIVSILAPEIRAAVPLGLVVIALTPTAAYLTFKTLPDIPSWFFSCVATFAIIRAVQSTGLALGWISLGTITLAFSVLFKNQGVLLPATFVLAGFLSPIQSLERWRLLAKGAAVGLGGAILTVLILVGLSIEVERYLGSSDLLSKTGTLAAKIMHLVFTGGFAWIFLPISFLTVRRRILWFFWIWLALVTAPFLLLFDHVEPRYLLGSLIPMIALSALAIEAVMQKLQWIRVRRVKQINLILLFVMLMIVSLNLLALRLMPYEVDLFQLRKALTQSTDYADSESPVFLSSWRFTEFHILRVLYPELDVYSVDTWEMAIDRRSNTSEEALRQIYHGGRQIDTLDQLGELTGPMFLIGFEYAFPPTNLAGLANAVRPGTGDDLLESLNLLNHLETGWIWNDENLRMRPIVSLQNYRVFKVMLADRSSTQTGQRVYTTQISMP